METATLRDMAHEGQTLKKLLTDRGVALDEFAKRCKLKGSSGLYNNYFKPARIGERAWDNARNALRSFGIDPNLIRPEPVTMMREKFQAAEPLRPLVEDWDHKRLDVLRRILLASPQAQEVLLSWLDGKLDQRR